MGGRTFLASPLTAAASAIAGRIADARPLVESAGGPVAEGGSPRMGSGV